MDAETRLNLVTRGVEEVITLEELRTILETKSRPRAYWGFEASGPMHIGMGLLCGKKIMEMVDAGFDFTIFLADWHSWRQADTSAVTRNYVKHGINILYPTYDDLSNVASGKDNPRGLRFVEFPLYNVASIITPIVIGYILSITQSFNGALVFVGTMGILGAMSYLFIVGNIKRLELPV